MALVDGKTGIEIIERRECLELLGNDDFGRVGVLDGGHPLILPVNYAMDGEHVVFRTGEGTKLSAIRGPASFEIDGHDSVAKTGWSVVVRGRLDEVTAQQQDTYARIMDLAKPWSNSEKNHVLRIIATSIRGRRIR